MVAECQFGAAIDECLHRLGGIHMLIMHEPVRLVGADRQNGELQRSVALTHFPEIATIPIGRVTDEIDAPAWRFDDE